MLGKNINDLRGVIIGQLTVIEQAATRNGMSQWRVRCACGKEKILPAEQLKSTKSCGCLIYRRGKENPNFNLDKTDAERLLSANRALIPGYRSWVLAVKAAYNNKCAVCDSRQKLAAHHIESFIGQPDLRTAVSNGICLCEQHHRAFHKSFGKGAHVGGKSLARWLKTYERVLIISGGSSDLPRLRQGHKSN